MVGGFWSFVGDGCIVNRSTDKFMAQAGFSQMNQKNYDFQIGEDKNILFKFCGTVVKPHVMGVATK